MATEEYKDKDVSVQLRISTLFMSKRKQSEEQCCKCAIHMVQNIVTPVSGRQLINHSFADLEFEQTEKFRHLLFYSCISTCGLSKMHRSFICPVFYCPDLVFLAALVFLILPICLPFAKHSSIYSPFAVTEYVNP